MKALSLFVLVASVVFLTAAGAGAFTWTLCIVAVLTCAVSAVSLTLLPAESGVESLNPRVEHALVAILLLLVLTLLPLPHALSPLMGSTRAAQNARVAESLQAARDAGIVDHVPVFFSLTRNRAGTMRIALLVAAALGVYILGISFPASWRKGYLRWLTFLGCGIAVAGYVAQWIIPQGDTLWWWIQIPHGLPGPVTCFVNRNHYAGFLALLCPVAVALIIDDVRGRHFLRAGLSLVCFGAMSLALLLSLSRGALLAYFGGLSAVPFLFLRRRYILLAVLLTVCLGIIVCGVLFLPHAEFQQRLHSMRDTASSDDLAVRMTAWEGCLHIWRAYPVLGAGANAFRTTYPQHRRSTERGYLSHPENEYAQALAETGLVGLCLAGALAISLGWRMVTLLRQQPLPVTGVAAAGALAAAAVHAVFEFALHAPLYALVLVSVVAVSVPREKLPASLLPRIWPALVALLCAAALCPFARPMQRLDDSTYLKSADPTELARALTWSPVSWQSWVYLGFKAARERTDAGKALAAHCITNAGRYDPNNYVLWQYIGKLRLRLKDYPGARAAFARVKSLRAWVTTPPVPDD